MRVILTRKSKRTAFAILIGEVFECESAQGKL
jgi:hypothetical protein